MEELETPPLPEVPEETAAEPNEAAPKEEAAAEMPAEPLASAEPEMPADTQSEPSTEAVQVTVEEVLAEAPEAAPVEDEPAEEPAEMPAEPLACVEPEMPADTPSEPLPEAVQVTVEEILAEASEAAPVEDVQLRAVIEAIIYVAEEPLTLAQLAAALHVPAERIRAVLDQLAAEYDKPEHGITIREVAGGFKMGTKPEHHEGVRSFVKSLKPPLKLSLPALETLAVIAYKQPVTGPEIMDIRGVQGAGVLKTLLDRKLIAVAGRKNVIGKPILYKTTKEFLIQFGLKDLSELPSLKEFEEIRRMALAEGEVPAAETTAIETAPPAGAQPAESPVAEAAPGPAEAPADAPAAEASSEPPSGQEP